MVYDDRDILNVPIGKIAFLYRAPSDLNNLQGKALC